MIGLVLGLLLARLLGGPESSDSPRADASGAAGSAGLAATAPPSVDELRAALERERAERGRLEAELALLREWAHEAAEAESDVEGEAPDSAFADAPEEAAPRLPAFDSSSEDPWFRQDALLELGLSESEVERIRQRWEQLTMDQLYAKDEHVREGGKSGPQLRREIARLKREARDELGEDAYDAMLYATGQKNRVTLQDVLETSPGWEAGLRPGDEVISYDGVRVFAPYQLRGLTRRGHPDGLAEVRVLRDGGLVRVFLPYGPLGARLGFSQTAPYLD